MQFNSKTGFTDVSQKEAKGFPYSNWLVNWSKLNSVISEIFSMAKREKDVHINECL